MPGLSVEPPAVGTLVFSSGLPSSVSEAERAEKVGARPADGCRGAMVMTMSFLDRMRFICSGYSAALVKEAQYPEQELSTLLRFHHHTK
jgi:hypothetical protein